MHRKKLIPSDQIGTGHFIEVRHLLEMPSTKSVIVVPPGYPAELIQDLLNAGILSFHKKSIVLLPPGKTHQYDLLLKDKNIPKRFVVVPSPGGRFFSSLHLKWLKVNLRSSEDNLLLIHKSLDRNFTSASVAFLVLLLSGKTITHLCKVPETDDHNQEAGPDSKWVSKEFNQKLLAKELFRRITLAPPGHLWESWEILYFLMFVSLIAKQSAAKYFRSLFKKQATGVKNPCSFF